MGRIYGDRVCRRCKGICHENSWRRKTGQRKAYYCSENCLRWAQEERVLAIARKMSDKWVSEFRYGDADWIEYRDSYFEPVEVKSP